MQYKINSGQYDVTLEEVHLDVQIGESAQMDVNQAVSYIKSGEKEIYNYVETTSKPAIDLYTRQKANQIVEEQIQPLVSDVTIATAHACSDAEAAAQSAAEAANYAYHAHFGMYERTFQETDWQEQNGKYVITYNDARIISAVYRNHQLMTNVNIVMSNSAVSMVSDTAFDGSCLIVNHIEKSGEEIDELLRRKQNVLTQTQLEAVNSGANTTNIGQIATNTGDIADIDAMIPTQASTSNQLADKNFVNSSIATNTSYFIGTFNSLADLEAYSGVVTNNDYAFVQSTDAAGNTLYDRYKYTTATTPASWQFEYELNNSSFTAAQWAAINSGATTTNIGQIATNTGDISSLQTGKQDVISDLSTIRSGASLGETSVQPNDNITLLTNNAGYVTETDYATTTTGGVVKVSASGGTAMNASGVITTQRAMDAEIAAKTNAYKVIVPRNLDYAVKEGVTNNANTLSAVEQTNACTWIGAQESNLVTSLSSSSTDAQYPSAKCVYDLIGDVETLLSQV